MGVVQILHVVLEGSSQPPGLRRNHVAELKLLEIGRDENAFHLPVHRVRGGVRLRVRANPSVVMNRRVQRIGAVADIMSEPARIENGIRFGIGGVAMFLQRITVFAEGDDQPLVHLNRRVRLQADSFRQQIVGMTGSFLAPGGQCAIEAVTVGRQLHALDGFEVDEVVGLLKALERQLRWTTPAVRFWSNVGQLVAGVPQKSRNIGRQFLAGHAIDGAVTFVAPGKSRLNKDYEHARDEQCLAPDSMGSLHSKSVEQLAPRIEQPRQTLARCTPNHFLRSHQVCSRVKPPSRRIDSIMSSVYL